VSVMSSPHPAQTAVPCCRYRSAGPVSSPPPGPVCNPPPGPVSDYVHAYKDQQDYRNDGDHKHPAVGQVTGHRRHNRDTGQHYLAPAE
jgi:hypothetical protein